MHNGNMRRWLIRQVGANAVRTLADTVVTEEPLEIRLAFEQAGQLVVLPLAVTMRTPGNDFELVAGFLYTEGLIDGPEAISRMSYCAPRDAQEYNIVQVRLSTAVRFDPQRLSRHFYMTSSCGVCGKAAIEAIFVQGHPTLPRDGPKMTAESIYTLPKRLQEAQALFQRTGGLHAAALFELQERGAAQAQSLPLRWLREDVGRHNSVDKVVGAALLARKLPLSRTCLMVSGRAGFEIAQKALRAGIPILIAMGAPSSLTLELARAAGMTVIGFLREQRFNVYTAPWRIEGLSTGDELPETLPLSSSSDF